MILEIKKYPDKILTRQTERVVEFDENLKKLVDDMAETMYARKGAGLAANQVGVARQVALVDAGEGLKILINPKITSRKGKAVFLEGCLSFPGLELEIKRPQKISVEFQDRNGQPKTIKTQEFLARAICHEVEHLQGKTFLDRLGWFKRLRIKRKLKKEYQE